MGAGYDFRVVRAELSDLYSHATLTSQRASALGQSVSASISDGGVNTNSVMASAYVEIPPALSQEKHPQKAMQR